MKRLMSKLYIIFNKKLFDIDYLQLTCSHACYYTISISHFAINLTLSQTSLKNNGTEGDYFLHCVTYIMMKK